MTDRRKDTSKFVTTWGRLEWSEELQQFVTVEREGYLYDGPWALAMDTPPVWVAEDYQWFDDDGAIGSATSLAAENTAVTVGQGTQLRLRGNFGETNNAAGTGLHTGGWTLYYRINTGSWTQLGAASDVRYFDSTHLTNGTAIASANYVLSWSGAGVQRDWGDECEDGVTISQTWALDYCEAEWTVDLFNVSVGDTVEFRLRAPDGTSDVAFTSVPTINVAAVVTPAADTLTIAEQTPVRVLADSVFVPRRDLRVYSVVGLQLQGLTPTVDVSVNNNVVEEPDSVALTIAEQNISIKTDVAAGNPDALLLNEQTPTIGTGIAGGNPDALLLNEQNISIGAGIAGGAPDPLVLTGQDITPSAFVDAGNPDPLVLTGQAPNVSVGLNVFPDTIGLTIAQQTPVPNILIDAGAPDALAITEQGNTLNLGIAGGAPDALLLNEQAISIKTDVAAGAPDALLLNEQAISLKTDVAAGNPDPLILTGQAIPLVDDGSGGGETVIAGDPDALLLNEQGITIKTDVAAGAPDALILAEQGISLNTSVAAGAPDALTLNEQGITIATDIAAGNPDPLVLTGQAIPLVDDGSGGGETVLAGDPDALTLNEQGITLNTGVAPGIDTLTINEQNISLNVTVAVGSDSLTIAEQTQTPNILIDAGDPDALSLGSTAPAIGTAVVAGAPDALTLNEQGITINAGVAVTPDSLSLSGQAPGLSLIVAAGAPDALSLAGQTPIVGNQVSAPDTGSLALTGIAPNFAQVANPGVSIVNPNATTAVPTNYVICDMTGFKQLPDSLRYTYKGYGVRRKSYEERNPTEYAKAGYHREKGPRRPEQDDSFIEDLYPGGVDAEDL